MSEIIPSLVFTQNAASKVYELIQVEGNLNLNLRVFITGGGCSGFKYGFTFDEIINEDDLIIKQKISDSSQDKNSNTNSQNDVEVNLLVDSLSFQYLNGAEIDYREDLEGARFVIRSNPNAQTTCGCGSSFSANEHN